MLIKASIYQDTIPVHPQVADVPQQLPQQIPQQYTHRRVNFRAMAVIAAMYVPISLIVAYNAYHYYVHDNKDNKWWYELTGIIGLPCVVLATPLVGRFINFYEALPMVIMNGAPVYDNDDEEDYNDDYDEEI